MKKSAIFVALLLVAGILGQIAAVDGDSKDRLNRKLHILNTIVKELETNYVDTLAVEKVMDGAIGTLFYYTDPYCEYYPAGDQDEILQLSAGGYAGIGSVISKRGDKILISDPYWNSPARRYGLRAGDVIIAVDGDTVTATTEIGDVSKHLRGQAGTKVRVDVARPWIGPDSLLSFEITRDKIATEPVDYYGMLPDSVGYISLTTFSNEAAQEVKKAVLEMQRTPGFKGLILDLRNNGGGLLDGAVQIAGMFVPKGTEILRVRGRGDNEQIFKNTRMPIAPDMPIVVLVNGGTASSSEIVSGALQDVDRAVIMGSRTFGKGLVQSTRPLPYGDMIKLTTGRYYIPSGRLIQALNYSQRNDDGTPTRTPDSLTAEFRTRAGRIVRDGGGITPDIEVKPIERGSLVDDMAESFVVFDFLNRHVARHPEANNADSVLVDSVAFNEFKAFAVEQGFKHDRRSHASLDVLKRFVEMEGYLTPEVSAQIDTLSTLLHRNLDEDLERNRDEVCEMLEIYLSARYFAPREVARRQLPADSTVIRARELLADPEAYRKVLRP